MLCALACALLAVGATNCATLPPGPAGAPLPELPVYAGSDGTPQTWADTLVAAQAADVIILGERHDDATAHAAQAAWLDAYFSQTPGDGALALEMLTRDLQALVDRWHTGDLDTAAFVQQAEVGDWAGPDTWMRFYQPLLDIARRHGAPIVAANAPRTYVRLARTDGFEALRALPADEQALFTLPAPVDEAHYRDRFMDAIGAHPTDGGNGLSPEQQTAFFLAQQVWDATLADSAWRAAQAHGATVLAVGQFHSDYAGGLVQRLRARGAQVCTLSFVTDAAAWRADDRGRADFVLYTGGAETPLAAVRR